MNTIVPIVVWSCLLSISVSAGQIHERQSFIPTDGLGYEFGSSVDIDGNTAAVGDRLSNRVIIYERNNPSGSFVEKAILTPKNPDSSRGFGTHVAIDGNTVVVGMAEENNASGAVYVYSRPVSGWSDMNESAKLTASDAEPGDLLGVSVSVSGDMILAGATKKKINGVSRGAVYVYLNDSTWHDANQTLVLTESDRGEYGTSVSADEASGLMVVGSVNADSGSASACGAVYVYTLEFSPWLHALLRARLIGSDPFRLRALGLSVATNGATIVSGADGKNHQGSLYVFSRPLSGEWTEVNETAVLTVSDAQTFSRFGNNVAIDDDWVAAGAMQQNNSRGTAYLFHRPAGGWQDMNETHVLVPTDAAADDRFGSSVAMDKGQIFVGAERHGNTGAAYRFDVRPTVYPALMMYLLY